MKLGIVGLAGAGKATVFSALTQQFTLPANIGDNRIGTVQVPDDRVDILSDMYRPRKTIFARVEYFLPGKAGGSKKDAGVYNLVRDCDAILHVVRNFRQMGLEDPTPLHDYNTLNQEMMFADFVIAEQRIERIEKDKQRGKTISTEELSLLQECHNLLEKETPVRSEPRLMRAPQLRGFAFVSAKPQLVLFNNEDEDESLPVEDANLWAETAVIRGKLENELAQMDAEEAEELLAEFNIRASAMHRIIRRSYELLGLVSFFTVGEDEVRAWTIPSTTPAVEAAGAIHSDIQKGFIRAEVLAYDDLMAAGSFAEAKKAGTVRLEGKEYVVKDGDIVNFRFNV